MLALALAVSACFTPCACCAAPREQCRQVSITKYATGAPAADPHRGRCAARVGLRQHPRRDPGRGDGRGRRQTGSSRDYGTDVSARGCPATSTPGRLWADEQPHVTPDRAVFVAARTGTSVVTMRIDPPLCSMLKCSLFPLLARCFQRRADHRGAARCHKPITAPLTLYRALGQLFHRISSWAGCRCALRPDGKKALPVHIHALFRPVYVLLRHHDLYHSAVPRRGLRVPI